MERKKLTKSNWWPQRDSNPCFSLERASPCVVISPTSTPGATARCHRDSEGWRLRRDSRTLVKTRTIIALASAHPDARAHFEASADAERRPNGEGGCSPDDDSPAAHVSLTSPEPFPTRTRLD